LVDVPVLLRLFAHKLLVYLFQRILTRTDHRGIGTVNKSLHGPLVLRVSAFVVAYEQRDFVQTQ